MEKPIIIYTDGASTGNPGPGGFGVVMMYGKHRKEISGGFRKTTNNRMELMAVIEALKAIKRPGAVIELYSDSQYVVNAVEKGWLKDWERKGFKGKKNPDLWQAFLSVMRAGNFRIRFHWVRGHAGNRENERCDELAVAASQFPEAVDEVYESMGENPLGL